MDNKLLYTIKWQLSKRLDFKPFINIRDISRIENNSFIVTDRSKKFIELMRLVAIRVGVAPVCLDRSERILRVYGEKENLSIFAYIYNTIDKYRTDNYLARLWEKMEPSKRFKESRIITHYRIIRDEVLEHLTSKPPVKDYRRTQYLYSLYLYVEKMEKLDKKNWGSRLEENEGYHYVTKRFYHKRILG